jgi:alpha-tubulin suppressor-like RCC1 family protein
MLGIGAVFTVERRGAIQEIADAQGTEIIGVFGRSPAVATLANGIKPLKQNAIPASLNNEIAKDMTVTSLGQGKNHGLACTSLGAVYVWGDNSFGQLGLRASSLPGGFAEEPQLQAFLERQTIRKVAAGDQHSVALTEDYGVYAWGDNMTGQCGSGGAANGELSGPAKEDQRLVSNSIKPAVTKVFFQRHASVHR